MSASLLRALLLAVLAAAFACVLPACELEHGPDLIRVSDILPREVEVGDRLEITGEGFPQGRTARVTLRGDVHRPGEPRRRVVVTAEGPTISASRIELVLTDAMEGQICDHGDAALHSTFRGTVEVAFAAGMRGAPPVTGTLRDVTLDLVPASVRGHRIVEKTRDGEAFARFLGLALAPRDGHIVVTDVAAGSRAQRAGLSNGDVLASLDGLRLRDVSDFVTAEEHTSFVGVLEGGREHAVEIPVEGYGPRLPRDVAIVLLAGLAALLAIVAVVVATPQPLRWLEARTASSVRVAIASRRLPAPPVGVLLGVPTVLLTVGLGARIVPSFDGDVAIALVASTGAAVLASLHGDVHEGLSRGRRFAGALVMGLVILLGFSLTLEARGSLRLAELVRTTSQLPSDFGAFRSPGLLLAAGTVLAALVAARATRSTASTLSFLSDAVSVPLFVALFLGGAGVSEPEGVGAKLGGAAIFVGKCVGVGALVHLATRAFPATWRRAVLWRGAAWLLTLALVALGAHLAWTRLPLGVLARAEVPLLLASLPGVLLARTTARTVWLVFRPRITQDHAGLGPGKSWLV